MPIEWHCQWLCTVQELKVVRISKEVHDGLQFLYRSRAASKGQKPVWHSDLGRLSGGERTLVSLALILAISLLHMHHHMNLQDTERQVSVYDNWLPDESVWAKGACHKHLLHLCHAQHAQICNRFVSTLMHARPGLHMQRHQCSTVASAAPDISVDYSSQLNGAVACPEPQVQHSLSGIDLHCAVHAASYSRRKELSLSHG